MTISVGVTNRREGSPIAHDPVGTDRRPPAPKWTTRVKSRLGRDDAGLRTESPPVSPASRRDRCTQFLRVGWETVAALQETRMTATEGKSACTVRITVKLRPEEYDELFRHVSEIGSTMRPFPPQCSKGDEGGASRHGGQPPASKCEAGGKPGGLTQRWLAGRRCIRLRIDEGRRRRLGAKGSSPEFGMKFPGPARLLQTSPVRS